MEILTLTKANSKKYNLTKNNFTGNVIYYILYIIYSFVRLRKDVHVGMLYATQLVPSSVFHQLFFHLLSFIFPASVFSRHDLI